MALCSAPDLFVFAQRLRDTVNTKDLYVQAFAFWFGERELKLTRKTLAGMAGRTEAYVNSVLLLHEHVKRVQEPIAVRAFGDFYFSVALPTAKGARA